MRPEDIRLDLEARSRPSGHYELDRVGAEPPSETAIVLASISSSYFRLRIGLAVAAFAFPIVLCLGAGITEVQASISAYYHFHHGVPEVDSYGAGKMRDVFVGLLWMIGSFLFFYKGYSWQENLALNLAGSAAVLISLFPMDWPPAGGGTFSGSVHNASAVVFFLLIAYVCLWRSGDTLRLVIDERKRRNFKRIYAVLGALMTSVPIIIYLIHRLLDRGGQSQSVLLIEVAAIWIFAGFWLTKSREIATLERQRMAG